MAGSKSSTSPTEAFKLWVDMGDTRSTNGLFKILKAKGRTIGRATLIGWHKRYDWDQALASELATKAKEVEMTAGELADAVEPRQKKGETFAPDETFQGTQNALQRAASAMNTLVERQIARIIEQDSILELDEVMRVAKMAGDLATAAGTLHKLTAPPPAQRDPNTGILVGHSAAPAVERSSDAIMAMLLNPPMTRA